ncbi:MAG: GNAT family N-acetyltransferase [Candidatus Altiarchaeales archaeon]|nr:GNAT family N-acetyltransferase [Candidatus Altiarchaeales archaeon]MBD3416150.1 GNAT family N-acetyltransferase [Candidatus Altiarchaeales archaeon]
MPTKGLKNIFYPETIAVIGASNEKDSVGYSLMANMIGHGFKGTVYPVNIKSDSVQGVHAYKTVKDIPRQVDLAVIATPAKTVPMVMGQCGEAGVKGAVIISAGFKETGDAGLKLESEVREIATKHGIRVVGPNCLGVINPRINLNASFAIDMPLEGNIAFISQSGALCSSIIDWANDVGIGFSNFVSVGSMLDVDYGDLIDFFGRDPKTKSIVVYMESVKNAGKFMSAASGFARQKPIVIVKSGRYEEGRKAVVSHTGAIAGSDDVYSAAFQRAGVVRVNEVGDLFDIAEKLAKGPLPKGPDIAVITNAGGPGVMATDKIIEANGKLAEIPEDMIGRLDKVLPASWSRNNPLDVLGDAGADRYRPAVEECIKERGVDSVMVMLTPQAGTDITETAEAVAEAWRGSGKPITACWMGGRSVERAKQVLRENDIPVYPTPEKAVMPLIASYNYVHNLELLHETPMELTDAVCRDREKLEKIIEESYRSGNHVLSERESKEFLREYGINTNHAVLAKTREEAVKAANDVGYPVVLKIDSPQITHKTDAGGVMLSIYNDAEAGKAYDRIIENATNYDAKADIRGVAVMKMVTDRGFEMLLGSKRDEVFGQVVVFGAGGTLVEVLRDKSIGLPPLNQTLARRMMEEIKGFKLLRDGSRDRSPADLTELEKAIINFSQLIIDNPDIVEVDINPLLACKDKVIALDARIVLDRERSKKGGEHLCITPYPREYIEEYELAAGERILLRPIKPEDEPRMKELFESLSEKTIHYRFFHAIREITHEMLVRYCHNDYNREIAIVAEKDGQFRGVSRLMFDPGERSAEFAVVVTDRWQNKGLGSKLVSKIVDVARSKDLEKVYATVIKENHAMKHVAEKLGFKVEATDDPQIDALTLRLR